MATGALLASTPAAYAAPDGMSAQEAQDITGVVLDNPTPEVLKARQDLAVLLVATTDATEDYNAAQEVKTQAEATSATAQTRQAEAEAAEAKLEVEVGQIARSAYMGQGGLGDIAVVLDADGPQEATQRMSMLHQFAENRTSVLEDLGDVRRDATEAALDAQLALQQAKSAEATMAAKAQEVSTKTAEATERLKSLETDQARKERLAREAEQARSALASRGGSVTSAAAAGPAPAANTAAAQKALDFAYAQLGTAYVWGGTGNPGFDCSGLTSKAWAAAGVSIPRTSRAQYSGLPHVSRDQLEPGDLVFFGSPIHHVGMYIGNGMMINSPNSSSVVRIEKMWGDYVGAARPS